MKHAQFEEQLAIYRDLQGAERTQADEHLLGCAQCAARLQSYQTMDRELANLFRLSPDRRLRERFYSAIGDNPQGKKRTGASSGKLFGAMSEVAGAAAIIVVIVALWALFQTMNNSGLNSAGRATPIPGPTIASTSREVRGRLMASNGQSFEYTLSIPANWTGKFVIEQYADQVKFYYHHPTGKIAPTSGPILFGIAIRTQAEWDKEQGGPHGIQLLTRDGVVFELNIASDNPLNGTEEAEFQQLSGQVEDIARTFAVAPAPPSPRTLPPNAPTLAPTRTPMPISAPPGLNIPFALAWSPDGKMLAASTRNGIVLYDRDTAAPIRTLDEGEYTESIAFSPDGARLACTCGEGVIKLWDVKSGQLLKTLNASNGEMYFTSVAFSPDGQYLAGGTFSGTVELWDARGETLRRTLKGPNASIFRLAFSADSQRILTGSLDGSVKVWDAETGQLVCTVVDHEAQDIQFSPDGTRVATTNQGGDSLHILDVNSGGLLVARDGIQVMGFAFTADSKALACVCKAHSGIPLWDVSSGKAIGEIANTDPDLASLIGFSPDGRQIATSTRDGQVRIVNIQLGAPPSLSQEDIVWQAVVRAAGDTVAPILKPARVPPDLTEVWLDNAAQGTFNVVYRSAAKSFSLGAGAFNPPPVDSQGYQKQVTVRGQPATLQVWSSVDLSAKVWLWWEEPGAWKPQGSIQLRNKVSYLVFGAGLTPDGVIQVAASLTPVLTHTIQNSETLRGIASQHGVTVEALIKANGLADAPTLEVGQVLIIPAPSDQGTATAPPLPTESGTSSTPVSPTLSPNAKVGGRLAYVAQPPPAKARVDVFDLAGEGSWSIGNPPLTPLGWSPSGQYLLVLESDNEYAAYRYDGTLAGRYGALAQPFWAPLDALAGAHDWLALQDSNESLQAIQFPGGQTRTVLSRNLGERQPDRVIWSRDGWLAWTPSIDGISQQMSKAQMLYVRRVDDPNTAQAWKISGDATQAYLNPIDWVPGTRYVLAAKGAACNSCWSFGLPLVRIDADTGDVRDLGATMLLTREAYDWNPSQPGILALAVGGSRYVFDEHRLAILDVNNASLQYLTDPGTSAFEPAWSPDGKFLACAQMPASPNASGDGQTLERTLEGRVIITVDPASRIFAPLTRPGQAIDGWPHWSADGKYLLCARKHNGVTDVHLVNWDDAQDHVLVSGQAAPLCNYGGCGWSSMLEYLAPSLGSRTGALPK